MELEIRPKSADNLLPTGIIFQTSFWSEVKSRLGWSASAFDITAPGFTGDMLVLTRYVDKNVAISYVPQGPESGPDPESYGPFLDRLSASLARYLHPTSVFIRYDLPWFDPYALDEPADSPQDLHRPDNRLREMRMNYSTSWKLRKAPVDMTVADSVVIDISGTEEEILARMKPKTRYNIGLSRRKGVRVVEADPSALPTFYDLYLQTAERNRFRACDYRHFSALFKAQASGADSARLNFYLAFHDTDAIAGAIVARSEERATYLFGASSNQGRNLMGSYAVQWHAIRQARANSCSSYEMGAISPHKDPSHPFFGMYRFKTGFGGTVEHRVGSWDYMIDDGKYESMRKCEIAGMTFQI